MQGVGKREREAMENRLKREVGGKGTHKRKSGRSRWSRLHRGGLIRGEALGRGSDGALGSVAKCSRKVLHLVGCQEEGELCVAKGC